MPTPEALARQTIDQKLTAAGWIVQDFKALNLGAGPGVAVREFQTAIGAGGLCALRGSQSRGGGGGQAGRDDAARGLRAVGQVYGEFPGADSACGVAAAVQL